MRLIDTHAHLDEEAFATDQEEVIARAFDSGIAAILTIGTTAANSQKAVEIAQTHPNIFAVVGIQPNYLSEMKANDWQQIQELATAPKVVAIGETGLDRYWDYAPLDLQEDYFTKHIELACEHSLPFVVHCREAEQEVVSQLTGIASGQLLSGVMHSFCGDKTTAKECLNLGLHISFSGMLTFKKNKELREVAATIPRDKLLVETDSPYLAPTPYRGKRNEPAFVEQTARCLAEVREIPFEELANQTTANAHKLFQLSFND
ncbi:Uncharacterized metal-dependent hydrolase YcfH [hydrothermal vent metagenome]|uniref:Uncharacterized metal-dependent hydrolase YcfH n=1 Tax=hydrothermal vent metagenome TaxID=652676 RepID=A0A3B1DAM1_9ZZZZ